jgi:hypothetical protein
MTTKSSKKATTASPPTVITVTLPDEAAQIRTGTILVQRGTLATLRQFTYSDLTGIMKGIQDAAAQLMEVEKNPPNIVDKPVTTVTEVPATDEVVLEEPADHVGEDFTEANGDPDPDSAPADMHVAHTQTSLF